MRSIHWQFAAACALTAASIVTADAHSTLETAEAAPGSYKAVIRIPHGCEGQPTHTVRVDLPEGFIGAKPMPKAGWELAVEQGDYARAYTLHGRDVASGATAIVWSSGSLDDGHYDEFVVTGTIDASVAGTTLAFATTQLCDDAQVAWTEVAGEGVDPHSLAYPAPVLRVSQAGGGDGHDHGHAHGHGAAETITAGDLAISDPWARAMLPGQPAGGGYLGIANEGDDADRLVSATSPRAGRVEIHTMEVVDDIMVMRPLPDGLEIPAGGTVALEPGGLHIMFMEVEQPFAEGDRVPVTLEFERAGSVDATFEVRGRESGGGGHDHDGHDHDGHGDHGNGHDHGSLSDDAAIEHVLKATWESDDAPLAVAPVVIEGDHAIAGWQQDGRGGRALLRKVDGSWRVHLCTGDAVKSAANLQQMGVPEAEAAVLEAALRDAESALPEGAVALFDSFEGTVMVAEGDHHHGHH
jgi:periplasmic copper chaperone A